MALLIRLADHRRVIGKPRGKVMSLTSFDVEVIEASGVKPIPYADGAILFNRGDEGDCAFIVKRGKVRIYNGVPIEVMQAGEIFGEMALIDDEPRSASAVAVGITEIIPIDKSLFEVLVRDDSDFSMTVMRLMTRRLRATLAMLEQAVGHPVPATTQAGASLRIQA
jgi:CRP/FNR family transcriptional regulator, cyclic AMP receptor protein